MLSLRIGDAVSCKDTLKGAIGSIQCYVHPMKCFLMWAETGLSISMSLVSGKQSYLQGNYMSPFYEA